MTSRISLIMTVLMLASGTSIMAADKPAFRAGFAERDITPALGMERPGGYSKAFHTSIHDPCKVRAAVFDDGASRVAIVGLDALMIGRPSVVAARTTIHERTGMPPESVLISASHSHSSGPTGMVLPGEFDDAPPAIRALAYEKTSCANADYLKQVEQAIADAVCEAFEKRGAATAGVGFGIEDQVAFNRRFHMRNGLTFTHPRPGNPEMLDVAGPTDPQVGVVGAWNADGKLTGCIVNFACHATTSPAGASATYIYYLERVIRGTFGNDVIVVFLPGACGDITQVDNLSPFARRRGDDDGWFVGGRIGAEAVKVLLSIPRGELVPVAARTTTLECKRRVPRPDRVAHCEKIVAQDPAKVGTTDWVFAKEILLLDYLVKKAPEKQVEIQAVQVGPAVFVTNPAEYFCQFGLDIKAGSPFPFTFPVELANDCVGYVPTEEALGPRGGGYETRLTFYSNLEPNAGRRMAEAGVDLAKQLTPGTAPTFGPAPPFKADAWGYGAVPPELD
ncbi:MAG TPA: hypothetical protein VG713_13250 [Pirellulales bacterium]|nr:hypothetical protein [Pirellulales bacterium]